MYSLERYYRDLEVAKRSGAKVYTIGKSTLGRDIHLVTKGSDPTHTVLVNASVHAREYITTPLTLRLLTEYNGDDMVALVPMVNVDGVLLVCHGLDSIEDKRRRDYLLRVNGGSRDFSLWKANANAVDINVSFPAKWGEGRSNRRVPSSESFIGRIPMQEVDNRILAGITQKLLPKITMSYHTKGEVVYHGFDDNLAYSDIAERIAEYLGYDLKKSRGSYGGYKDYFMKTTPYLGVTIECGADSMTHPIGMDSLDMLYERHRGIFDYVSSLARGIY